MKRKIFIVGLYMNIEIRWRSVNVKALCMSCQGLVRLLPSRQLILNTENT